MPSPQTKRLIISDKPLYEAFEHATRVAEKHGLPSYSTWRADRQRQYECLPAAYFDVVRCKQWYTTDILEQAARKEVQ